jgi:two-component system nitrogen regulation sensor histidine kinase NtrY
MSFEPIPEWAMEEARGGGVSVLTSDDDDRVRALVRLRSFGDAYLYVGRFVEPRVLNHLEQVREAVKEYKSVEGQRTEIEFTFAMIFATVALLFLLVAVWVGFNFATGLARPVIRLVEAAERVRAGDLTVRVRDSGQMDELEVLSRAFNRMTTQLSTQRGELIEANRQLDDRRRFTEAVLSGVASGVIGLDSMGLINLPNRTASRLLSMDLEWRMGESLEVVVPEMAEALDEARRRPTGLIEKQVEVTVGGQVRTFLIRVAVEQVDGTIDGFVVTFNDITELLSAQRKAAWSDIARRIAHEIKNPLTPIQLSAERLKRRYLKQIEDDPETFEACTDTIVRQVDDLRQMVDEFSSFARLPTPEMRQEDLVALCERAIFLQRNAHPDFVYRMDLLPSPVWVTCDSGQIGQVLTNILQNAADAIEARLGAIAGTPSNGGEIAISMAFEDKRATVSVEDNGIGLVPGMRDKVTEPYVTTRLKGTGLGLAIVKKILEDHGAEFRIEDRADGGTCAHVIFARTDVASDGALDEPARETAHGV